MKKIIIFLFFTLFTFGLTAQNVAGRKVSSDTLRALPTNINKKVYCKDTFNIVTGWKYITGAGLNKIWASNLYGLGSWVTLSTLETDPLSWKLLGNSGTTAATNFIGTTDNIPFIIRVNNVQSGRITTTLGNTYLGYESGFSTTGTDGDNTAYGMRSMKFNTEGSGNVAIGVNALYTDTTGNYNVAVGQSSLQLNVGSNNTAIGYQSLYAISLDNNNIALGSFAGRYNTLSNRLYIGAFDTGSEANDSIMPIIYARMNPVSTNQSLYLNSQVYLPYLTNVGSATDSVLVIDGATNRLEFVAQGSIFDSTAFLAACHTLFRVSDLQACSPMRISSDEKITIRSHGVLDSTTFVQDTSKITSTATGVLNNTAVTQDTLHVQVDVISDFAVSETNIGSYNITTTVAGTDYFTESTQDTISFNSTVTGFVNTTTVTQDTNSRYILGKSILGDTKPLQWFNSDGLGFIQGYTTYQQLHCSEPFRAEGSKYGISFGVDANSTVNSGNILRDTSVYMYYDTTYYNGGGFSHFTNKNAVNRDYFAFIRENDNSYGCSGSDYHYITGDTLFKVRINGDFKFSDKLIYSNGITTINTDTIYGIVAKGLILKDQKIENETSEGALIQVKDYSADIKAYGKGATKRYAESRIDSVSLYSNVYGKNTGNLSWLFSDSTYYGFGANTYNHINSGINVQNNGTVGIYADGVVSTGSQIFLDTIQTTFDGNVVMNDTLKTEFIKSPIMGDSALIKLSSNSIAMYLDNGDGNFIKEMYSDGLSSYYDDLLKFYKTGTSTDAESDFYRAYGEMYYKCGGHIPANYTRLTMDTSKIRMIGNVLFDDTIKTNYINSYTDGDSASINLSGNSIYITNDYGTGERQSISLYNEGIDIYTKGGNYQAGLFITPEYGEFIMYGNTTTDGIEIDFDTTKINSAIRGVLSSTTITQDTIKYKVAANSSDIFLLIANKQMHDNANDTLFSLVIGSDSAFSCNMQFNYRNNDGTDQQTRSGFYNIAVSIKTGSEAGYQFTSSSAVEHLTGGSTLAETLSVDYVQATSTLYVIAKYNSSLTPTTNKLNYSVLGASGVKTVITPYLNVY
jgi:hypothetical protein